MSKLIGKIVEITSRESWAFGEWGRIKDFDGDYYYISLADADETLIFDRDEFKVKRGDER